MLQELLPEDTQTGEVPDIVRAIQLAYSELCEVIQLVKGAARSRETRQLANDILSDLAAVQPAGQSTSAILEVAERYASISIDKIQYSCILLYGASSFPTGNEAFTLTPCKVTALCQRREAPESSQRTKSTLLTQPHTVLPAVSLCRASL